MKKHNYILLYPFILLFFAIRLFAIEGTLAKGDGSSFTPQQGSAFSVILDIENGFYSGEYDVLIRVNNKIYYDEKDQINDIYMVFNEPVDSGDIIRIDVKNGQFKFKLNSIETLPEPIANAIKQNVYSKQAPSDSSDYEVPISVVVQDLEEETTTSADEISFFSALTEKISSIFKKSEEVKKEEVIIKSPVKEIVEPMDSIKVPDFIKTETVSKTTLVNKPPPVVEDKIINQYDNTVPRSFDSKGVQVEKSMPSFNPESTPSIVGGDIEMPQSDIVHQRVQKPSFNQVAPSVRTEGIGQVSEIPQFKKHIKTQPEVASVQEEVPDFNRYNTPESTETKIDDIQEIKSVPQEVSIIEDIAPIEEPIFNEPIQQAPVVYEPRIEPIQDNIQRIVITKTLTPKQQKQKQKEAKKSSPRIIKRHIQPKEYTDSALPVPDRMSDRVQSGEYGIGGSGNLQVKAYNNNKEVSAWIEVFKAGTTTRVKTFYTGKGRSLKDIKLPAGVYVIKATYRSKTDKKRRNLGKVVLGEGESINKSISFDGGKIKILATKGGKPLYAKVEVFKKGSSRRVMYEFTSRRNGIAIMNLGTGRYDIVVNNHLNILNYDNIKVRAGKTRVINADF